MSLSKLTVGCDPEWFLTNGKHAVSAIDKFQGTKDQPVPLENGVSVQVDNCAVEYGIVPAESEQHWVDLNLSAREQIDKMAQNMGLQLLITPSVQFPEEELQDERAWIFGCDPDYNAWTLAWNDKPMCDDPFLRSAGGHLHVGYQFTPSQLAQAPRALDLYIAVPGLFVDTDTRRRLLYGKAGAMRFKKYGFEWRTASNFWTVSESRIRWAYRALHRAMAAVVDGLIVPAETQIAIDRGDLSLAKSLVEAHNLEVPE